MHIVCTLYGDVVCVHCMVMLVCTLYGDVGVYTVW